MSRDGADRRTVEMPPRSSAEHFAYHGDMFTGIVQTMGRVERVETDEFGLRLLINPTPDQALGRWDQPIAAGDSVAVNGCCLTHAPRGGAPDGWLAFDVIRETLDKTSLGSLQVGDRVNLEPSLTAGTPLGGHFVQGHIEATAPVVDVLADAQQWRTTIQAPAHLMDCIVPKGCIAIDGVSLTVAHVDPASRRFTVALIPTTLELTTLGQTRVGDTVNLETDILTRTVVQTVKNYMAHQPAATLRENADAPGPGPISRQALVEAGLQNE